ncbi:MAG: alpha/beta hydrolase [Phycisphaerales bacterium]|jgi:pimeloyl-ACP methyl ester carboxylesterase|nr:alpha/beta hydrolase [Phycisphaerales bacterium]
MKTEHFAISYEGASFQVAADVRRGGADLLFFVHGLGCSKGSFCHVWDRADFSRADFSIAAIDLVGFGDSDRPGDFPYTMEAQAKVVADVLSEFSGKRLHIVAHSMGGAIGLLLGDEILGSTETFTNVEGNLIGADCEIGSRGIISVTPEVFAAEMLPAMRAKYAELGPSYAAIDSTTADILHRSAESLVAWSDSVKLLEAFDALACRKAYFYGDENAAHPTVSRVGEAARCEIKRSGHFPMSDNPEDFYTALHRFISPQ